MPLDTTILEQIKDEIGASDTSFVFDDTILEGIYVDENRGNFSTLVTALIVWKRRLHNLQTRAFDVTTGGNLYSRSQRIRFIERRVKELELVADETIKGKNMEIQSPATVAAELAASAEFS